MAKLLIGTALTQIEQALHRLLRRRLLVLTATVADVAALRAYPTQAASGSGLREFSQVGVTAFNRRYEWQSGVAAADNGLAVIRPADVDPTATGRWLLTDARASVPGYVTAVNFWQGETKKSEFKTRILAETPSLAIMFESADSTARSTVPGAIYDYAVRFSVWCADTNLRDHYEALLGSAYSFDAGHPGAMTLLGDAKKALADENKRRMPGAEVGNALDLEGGVKFIAMGSEDVEDADLAERWILMSLGIEVLASVENPDDDDEHQRITSVYVDPQLTHLNAADAFDPSNFVVSGLQVAPQTGLLATPSQGIAYVGGNKLHVTPTAASFPPDGDTYLDVYQDVGQTGAVNLRSVARGLPAPAVTPEALRVARIVTDSLGIVDYEPIAPTSNDFGGPYQVLPSTTGDT